MKKIAITITTLILLASCNIGDVLSTAGTLAAPSNSEIIKGLKSALVNGVTTGTLKLNKTDAFWSNLAYKILMPQEVKNVEGKLRALGLGTEVDKAVKALNTGAGHAMKEAVPVFKNAITSMSITDAMGILKGGDGAATNYLARTTTTALHSKFKPVIQSSLNTVGATKHWTSITSTYNLLASPSKRINTDLAAYVTGKATTALFSEVKKEENLIRKDPLKRTTDILKKVFGYADTMK